MHSSFDPLDELLGRADQVPATPPHLAARVRRRVVEHEAARAAGWLARLDAVFARPSFATLFVAACMLLGLFLAEARLSRLHAERGAQIARSYLQLIDPLIAQTATASAPAK
ncbi:MAG TPA: hypothetical protein VHD62_04210 [Opitutaceae bacterium]|nr:hypothetical protein [Opitutaceae bacterium]